MPLDFNLDAHAKMTGPPSLSVRPIAQLLFCTEAGGFDLKRLNRLTYRLQADGYDVHPTACGPGSITKIMEATSDLAIMGGDGTIRHAVDATLSQGYKGRFTIHAGGTVNLLVRNLRDQAATKQEVACYIADTGDTPMLNCASIGPDAQAVFANVRWLKRLIGRASYAIALIFVFLRWERPSIRLRWQGGDLNCEAVYISKSRYYAGPWRISPDACITTPTLHGVALRLCRRRDYLRFVLTTLFGWHKRGSENIVRFKCEMIDIDTGGIRAVQIDGDSVRRSSLRIAINPIPIIIRLI